MWSLRQTRELRRRHRDSALASGRTWDFSRTNSNLTRTARLRRTATCKRPTQMFMARVIQWRFTTTQLTRSLRSVGDECCSSGIIAGTNLWQHHDLHGNPITSSLQLCDNSMSSTGMTLESARAAGFDADAVTFEDNYRPEFMPTNAKVIGTVVWDRATTKSWVPNL